MDRGRAGFDRPGGSTLVARLGWRPVDLVALGLAGVATVTILVNALFLQQGRHPAPIWSGAPTRFATVPAIESTQTAVPRPRPVRTVAVEPGAPSLQPSPQAASPTAPSSDDIVTELQRALAQRGRYDGPVDGLFGPRTEAALRAFERSVGLQPGAESYESLLRRMTAAPQPQAAAQPAAAQPATVAPQSQPPTQAAVTPPQPAADAAPTPQRIAALQRVLSDYGFGQVEPSGVVDTTTAAAIREFERVRHLPVTGRVSDKLVQEVRAVTGEAVP